ncbi:MAG: hypothetical protein IT340_12130 [Chloroflexi bacterium]|nr:hypothetical protein [Chloroflexota bacterium]
MLARIDGWTHDRAPHVEGFVAMYGLHSRRRPGEIVSLVIFTSEAAYLRNAADPTQDRWFLGLRSLLEVEPEWEDGAIDAFLPDEAPR